MCNELIKIYQSLLIIRIEFSFFICCNIYLYIRTILYYNNQARILMAIALFSFFSGAGLLDLGFENDDFDYDIVFVNEFKDTFLNAYIYTREQNNMNEPLYGYHCRDINDFINTNNSTLLREYVQAQRRLNNIVGFIGGPPCPDFSIGGKNLGRNGDNGILARSYVNLIIAQRPNFFIFENVRGLVRTAKHKAYFDELKQTLSDAGYIMSDTILNALSFGVPQDRDRVILMGILNENLPGELPINADGTLNIQWLEFAEFNYTETKNLQWPIKQTYRKNSKRIFRYDVPEELTVEYWFRNNNVCHHPNSRDRFKVRKGLEKMSVISEGDTSKKSFKRLHRWRYSPTAAYGNNEVHLHPYKTRRLSVAEAMAIQSLPSWFCLPKQMPLTHKFKVIGNGVPYLMSLGIARTVNEFLNQIFNEVENNGR